MQLQVQQNLFPQVTRDEKTSCKEQQLKEQGKRQHNLQYLLKQTLKEGILEE